MVISARVQHPRLLTSFRRRIFILRMTVQVKERKPQPGKAFSAKMCEVLTHDTTCGHRGHLSLSDRGRSQVLLRILAKSSRKARDHPRQLRRNLGGSCRQTVSGYSPTAVGEDDSSARGEGLGDLKVS
jgi:hypothetical protein